MNVPMLLPQFLDRAVKVYGKKAAIVGEKRTYTYREINDRVNQLSRGLQEAGINKGDRVAYLAPNTSEMYEGFYGVLQLGAVMVPLNTRLKPEDYLYILNHSGTRVLFVDDELLQLIQPVLNELTTVEAVFVHGLEEDQDALRSYEKWLSSFESDPVDRPDMDENDLATLLYTSGTTGKPKGVMLSHRSNFMHALTTQHHLRVSDHDVLLHVLPMFHVNGWGSPFYYTANGATQVFLKKVVPADIFQKVKENSVTVMHMAPTVLNGLLQYAEQQAEEAKTKQNIRIVIAGSAPPPVFVKAVEEKLKWEFIQVYGMTEAAPLITTSIIRDTQQDMSPEEKYRLKAKAGYEFIGSEVKVVNENGEEVTPNGKEIGEIIVRSNTVMEGYWNNPEETHKAIRDGFYHTGDMAFVDEEGNIEIADRKKDIIISGGENISSIEVEAVLYDHPAVVEAAVIAVPHDKWGETPQAVVVLREGYVVSEDELITFARSRMAHFKAPTIIKFVDDLPKTASGKIQKVHLRKAYWENKGKLVN